MSQGDRIKPRDVSITTYLEDLKDRQYQIPTFQREVVWERDSIKKLWDSIYRFYPIGSILLWKTDITLEKHREIGGHDIDDPDKTSNFNYILDGQQRTTSLLTTIYGADEDWAGDFDPKLYVDLTVEEVKDVDDSRYRERFLFEDEASDETYVVSLERIMTDFGGVERQLVKHGHEDYDDPVRGRLRRFDEIFRNYRIPFIELRDIQIQEVTEIFERVNQEGKPLDIFDIVVAKTFRPGEPDQDGFYLRELIETFREETDGEFVDIGNKTYLQMLAMIIKYHVDGNNVRNITDTFLNNITTEQIEAVWEDATEAFRETFDFFENHLNLKGPNLVPFRYFYITVSFYFYDNDDPDYDLLKRYFWFYSFHTDNLLRHTQHLRDDHLDWLHAAKRGEPVEFDEFVLDRKDLRSASYSYRGRFSRAILALLANQDPKAWKHPDRSVLNEVYYQLRQEPNLHHVFPRNFVQNYPEDDVVDEDSLMNIAYLPRITNLEISDKNPVEYARDYDRNGFEEVLQSHLIPLELLNWARDSEVGYRTLDEFIDLRVEEFVREIEAALDGVDTAIIDTSVQDTNVRVLIEDGEDQTTEFKSTLRTDVKDRGMPTRAVEYQCLKTINGFLNSDEGGQLLIGVQDDGTIYGLQDDYETFQEDQKREAFRRHVYDLIRGKMEPQFNDFVTISFPTVGGDDVCLVDVDHADEPAFLDHEGEEQFYVRRGNRTVPVEGKEQLRHIEQFF